MVVELISVGTEILLGNIVNTNANYLSKKCAALGLSVYYEVSVGDNEKRLGEAIKSAMDHSDIVILTGGLGPTKDDLTKETVANVLGLDLVEDPYTKARIEEYFEKGKFKNITENNWKQAQIIEGAEVLDNNNGTAPGFIVETKNGKRVILLPGPPNEMKPMFEKSVYPYLAELNDQIFYSKMVKICGVGESQAETMVEDLIENQTNPTIAPYAKTREVHFRVTASAKTEEEAKKLIKPILKELKNRFKENIYTTEEDETLEENVVKLLKKYNLTVTTAESCTGGLVAGKIINVPGASDVFNEGVITYSNKSKRKYLGVNKSTLKKDGAVSARTVKEMVKGAAISTGSDTAIAVTGFAGPDDGTGETPVGLVYIACYVNEKSIVKEFVFKGNREKIREQSVISALDMLRRCIMENYKN